MWLGTLVIGIIFCVLILFLLLLGGVTKLKLFSYLALALISLVVFIGLYAVISRPFYTKVVLDKEDFYGDYTINRAFFKGEQADWQYDHFRIRITPDDSVHFYTTDGASIQQTYKGRVIFIQTYPSTRVSFDFKDDQQHHVIASQPTVYRGIWGFNMVFKSSKFNNMYFTKNQWKAIDE